MRKIIILLMSTVITIACLCPAFAAEPSATGAPKPATPDLKPVMEPNSPVQPTTAPETKPAQPALIPPSVSHVPFKAEQAFRLGIVDMTKVASESSPGKAALAEVKSKAEKYQSQVKEKEKQLQKQKAAIEAQLPSLSPKLREVRARDFQKKVEEFQKFVQKADAEVRARQEELLAKLYQSIATAAADYGKTNGFSAVIVKKDILYVAAGVETKDLTDEIIKKVNAMKPEKRTSGMKGPKTSPKK